MREVAELPKLRFKSLITDPILKIHDYSGN